MEMRSSYCQEEDEEEEQRPESIKKKHLVAENLSLITLKHVSRTLEEALHNPSLHRGVIH